MTILTYSLSRNQWSAWRRQGDMFERVTGYFSDRDKAWRAAFNA